MTFTCDQLDTGEGDTLYTLRFLEDEYYLNSSDKGIIAYGSVQAGEDRSLVFEGDSVSAASYKGSAFEQPSVSLSLDDAEMLFKPATENSEYIYLLYLGSFVGDLDGKDAVFILERWNEWYLFSDGILTRGTYEIFSDGKVELTTDDGEILQAFIENGPSQGAGIDSARIMLKKGDLEAELEYSQGFEKYDAAHAMGTYTLSVFSENVFEIHGVDGFLKAFGTLENGKVTYFPRKIAADAESGYSFDVEKQGDTYYFPERTYLLPRSGNIDKQTGTASYWSAGTRLEFIKRAGFESKDYARELFSENSVPIKNNFPEFTGSLRSVLPTSGKAKPLAILIDFPDQTRPRHVSAEGIEKALFSLDEADSLSSFYYISSYGKLNIEGRVLGWYRMSMPRSSYESDREIMREALGYYIEKEGLDLADYDADDDGIVDSLYIFWAGNMQAGTGMWDSAYRSTWESSPESWSRKITGYIFVPGSTIWSSVPPLKCNTNSLIHESGHLLGLNDYYSYDTSDEKIFGAEPYTGGALEGGLGGMDMMDTNIGDHNAFSKWLLGWTEPVIIEYEDIKNLDGNTYALRPSAKAGDALFIKLKPSDSMYTELLVVEAVAPVYNFAEYTRLAEPVVRILHVAADVAAEGEEGGWRGFGFRNDNSYTSTKFISIIEADGNDSVLNFVPSKNGEKISYEAADYFTAGSKLLPDGYPNTSAYDKYGNASIPTGLCVYVESIGSDGTAIIKLEYKQPSAQLELKSVSAQPVIVPAANDVNSKFDPKEKEIIFNYCADIEWVDPKLAETVRIYSGGTLLEDSEARIEGSSLKVSLKEGFKENTSYTVVIPAGIIRAAKNDKATNNYNGIYGFISKP